MIDNNRIYEVLTELGISNANAAQVNIVWELLRQCQTEKCDLMISERTERNRRKAYDHKLCVLRDKLERLLTDPPGRRKLLRKLQRYMDDSIPVIDPCLGE